MTETKFTPGPWSYRPMKFDDWGYVRGPVEPDGFHTFICQAKDIRATEDDENKARMNGTDPWAANAHLIASAPDLYAIADILARIPISDETADDVPVTGVDGVYITHGDIRAARAITSKARGEV